MSELFQEAPAKGPENRQFKRSAVLWSATLDCGDRPLECQVYNFSAGGAKLRMGQQAVRRSQVQLAGERFGAIKARIVWQHEDWVGLSFLDEPEQVARAVVSALPAVAA